MTPDEWEQERAAFMAEDCRVKVRASFWGGFAIGAGVTGVLTTLASLQVLT